MAKGKNRGTAQHNKPERPVPELKKRSQHTILALVLCTVSLVTGGYFLYQEEKPPTPSPKRVKLEKGNIIRRENRPTLAPERFSGKIRDAYAIARAIPEVLDQLYCYCSCQSIGHKSLLSCYVDDHASAWDICMDEAQLASQMHAKGATAAEIQAEIDQKFGK